MVEADRVDVMRELPCAVEKTNKDAIVFDIVARFMLSVLPVKLDIVVVTALMVEPISVDATDITFAATVLPLRVDT
jgi:hypothetical protein